MSECVNFNRRDFLTGAAWMGAAALAGGCMLDKPGFGVGGKMATFADKPFKKLRVGLIGLSRGLTALGFNRIPGCEVVAICDLIPSRIEQAQKTIAKIGGRAAPKVYTGGPEEWKKLCDDPNVDLVYNATPWELHVPISLYAMNAGKHVAVEVPGALTVEGCWALVETSERLNRHCMMLENCCYGQNELLALNLCKSGVLGEVFHGEGAYIHDLRDLNYRDFNMANPGHYAYPEHWMLLKHLKYRKGNRYPTHGLGPLCWCMDINRGDRFDYLVSLESDPRSFQAFAKDMYPADSWKTQLRPEVGDLNTMLIKTVKGKSIMIQFSMSSPRPYSRLNTVTGTKGILQDYPLRMGWGKSPKDEVHSFFDAKTQQEMIAKYNHPLWKQAGEIAKKIGGHGGMDFLMILRLAYCLQSGLPLDENVYDLASWSCLCELSEKSVRNRSQSVDIPDFTNGGWERTAPLGDLTVDLGKLGFAV